SAYRKCAALPSCGAWVRTPLDQQQWLGRDTKFQRRLQPHDLAISRHLDTTFARMGFAGRTLGLTRAATPLQQSYWPDDKAAKAEPRDIVRIAQASQGSARRQPQHGQGPHVVHRNGGELPLLDRFSLLHADLFKLKAIVANEKRRRPKVNALAFLFQL